VKYRGGMCKLLVSLEFSEREGVIEKNRSVGHVSVKPLIRVVPSDKN